MLFLWQSFPAGYAPENSDTNNWRDHEHDNLA
jgi:hypothetical protein